MNKDEGREEYHSTFPIVTKNRIYSSMYLETYDIVESVNTGMNMLTITLFLRKYRPPYPLEFAVTRSEGKKKSRTAWYRSEKVKNEPIWTKLSLRWSDSIIDFGLSALIGIQRHLIMVGVIDPSVEEMTVLNFANNLDKSKGLDTNFNVNVTKDKFGNIMPSETIEKLMGVAI